MANSREEFHKEIIKELENYSKLMNNSEIPLAMGVPKERIEEQIQFIKDFTELMKRNSYHLNYFITLTGMMLHKFPEICALLNKLLTAIHEIEKINAEKTDKALDDILKDDKKFSGVTKQ